MTFLNLLLLWSGLALATGPIIIHLLNRRRFRILDWAAMEFLLESARRNRRRIRLEELILLALRVAVIALMGIALARPFVGAKNLASVLGRKAAVDFVVILDDSYSMAQRSGVGTIFDRARDAAGKLVSEVTPADRFSLLLVSKGGEPFFAPAALTDIAGFQADLKSLVPSDYATDLVAPLERAREIFADSRNPEKRLYLLGDFRQRDWDFTSPPPVPRRNGESGEVQTRQTVGPGQRIKTILEKLDGKHTRIFLLDFGLEEATNLTVSEFSALDKHVVKGMRAQFRATITNGGTQRVKQIPVTFTVAGQSLPVRVLDFIDPGQSVPVEFSYAFPDEQTYPMSVGLPADDLSADNTAYRAIDVRNAVPVLVVNGAPEDEPYRNEPDYFVAAIDPAGKGLSGYRPQVVTEEMLTNIKFADYDAVVLANVARIPLSKLAELETYVKTGGGVAIFLGDKIDRDFYNNPFCREGQGLQPLHLESVRGDPLDVEKFVRLKVEMPGHPVLGIFEGTGAAWLERTHFRAYFASQIVELPISPSGATDSSRRSATDPATVNGVPRAIKILAAFTDREQSPAWVERSFGQGKVYLFTSSLSARWNDWPRSPSYPVAMNELVSDLARLPAGSKTAQVGEPIRREVETAFLDAQIALKAPTLEQQPLKLLPKAEGEKFFVAFDKTARAGMYALELTSPVKTRSDFFARNVDPTEGNLVRMDPAVIKQHLAEVSIQYVGNLAHADLNLKEEAKGREFWRDLLVVLAGLLVMEQFLALRFGHYPPKADLPGA